MATWSELSNALSARRGSAVVTDDTDVAMEIVYIGDEDSATVGVDSSGDITFKHGDLGSEAVDTTVVASTGKIDVSNSSYDTFGEVVDTINASPNWRARLKGALRADSSNDTLLIVSATTLTPKTESFNCLFDTSAALMLTKYIGLIDLDRTPALNDDESCLAKIYQIDGISTFTASGSSSGIYVYAVETDKYGNRTETLIHSTTGLTTATLKTLTFTGGLKMGGVDIGHGLLVRLKNVADMSSGSLTVDFAYVNALEV